MSEIHTPDKPPGNDPAPPSRVSGTFFDTSEIELLVSGAFLFSLFKAPELLTRLFHYIITHFINLPVFLFIEAYASMAAYTLIIGFIVHIVTRGFWVGLQGLHSVYPHGIKWENMKISPLVRDMRRSHWPTLERMIVWTDKVSSSVFAVTLSLFFVGLCFGLFFVIVCGLTLVARGFFPEAAWVETPLWGFALLAAPAILTLLFLAAGKSLSKMDEAKRASSTLYRLWRRFFGFFDWMTLSPITGPILETLRTNLKNPKGHGYLLAASAGVTLMVILSLGSKISLPQLLPGGNYPYFVDAGPLTMKTRYYESLRDREDWLKTGPFVAAPEVKGAYFKLYLRYEPRMSQKLRAVVPPQPEPEEPEAADEAARANLAALLRYYRFWLNDQPLPDLDFVFYRHPRNELRTLMAFVPTGLLQTGRNTLRVEYGLEGSGEKEPRKHYILLWK